MSNSIFKTRKFLNSCNNLSINIIVNRLLNTTVIEKRNEIFDLEKKRQFDRVGRIEKIEVQYQGQPENATLIMNKDISTPYNCALHMGEMLLNRSALAMVDNQPWDMHRPLVQDCKLDFLYFTANEPYLVNKAFWRSCSFLLGATASIAFKDSIDVQLHSFPSPQVRSGSFVYDIDLGLPQWKPTADELRVLSAEMIKLCTKNLPFERLNVNKDIALAMFEDNKYKSAQIPDIAERNNGEITLYRVGSHIDISRGPMIGNTSFVGRCSIMSVHKLESENALYRLQGVALPKTIVVNHVAYRILEDRAKKLNRGRQPNHVLHNEPKDEQIALA